MPAGHELAPEDVTGSSQPHTPAWNAAPQRCSPGLVLSSEDPEHEFMTSRHTDARRSREGQSHSGKIANNSSELEAHSQVDFPKHERRKTKKGVIAENNNLADIAEHRAHYLPHTDFSIIL